MAGKDRQELRLVPVYSNSRIVKAMEVSVSQFSYSTFRSFHPKTLLKSPENIYYISYNKKIKDWQCTCWHEANRKAPDKMKWGYCAHILGLFFRLSKTQFYDEIKRKTYK